MGLWGFSETQRLLERLIQTEKEASDFRHKWVTGCTETVRLTAPFGQASSSSLHFWMAQLVTFVSLDPATPMGLLKSEGLGGEISVVEGAGPLVCAGTGGCIVSDVLGGVGVGGALMCWEGH